MALVYRKVAKNDSSEFEPMGATIYDQKHALAQQILEENQDAEILEN